MPDDTLFLRPEDDPIGRATQWLEAIAQRERWTARMRFGLILSMDEALTNIVSHAFTPPCDSEAEPAIRIAYMRDGDARRIDIADNGRPFDPASLPIPHPARTLDDAQVGGHGLRLMHHYLGSLQYRRQDDWNLLTLLVAESGA